LGHDPLHQLAKGANTILHRNSFHAIIVTIILIGEAQHHYPIESLNSSLSSAESTFALVLGAIIRSLFDDE